MDGQHDTENKEAALWNGVSGNAWVEMQEILDRLFHPMEQLLVDAVASGPAGRVLDVGCGTGGTTVAIARQLGTAGDCTGIDISEPMLAAARRRAERDGVPARFICADAQRYRFEPPTYDMVVSRFGVMFFDDFVEAFTNLRRATTQGGALRIIAWRGVAENPFMTTAERAAAPLVTIPPRPPDGPGQFAFADENRVRSILEQSGWSGIDFQPIDVVCTMSEKDLPVYLSRLGALGRTLAEMDESTCARIVAAVLPAFEPYIDGSDIQFTAACWMVSASA